MKYNQPQLPYAADSLEPAISRRTVDFHYGKHEKAYIDNLNNLIEGTEFADLPLEEIIHDAKGPLCNNASQAWNHIFYFFSFSPDGGGEPEGELREAIDRDFGSFENSKGIRRRGRQTVWLGLGMAQPRQRRKTVHNAGGQRGQPHNQRTHPYSDLRRLGTCLLPRLSEPACRRAQRALGHYRLAHCRRPLLTRRHSCRHIHKK